MIGQTAVFKTDDKGKYDENDLVGTFTPYRHFDHSTGSTAFMERRQESFRIIGFLSNRFHENVKEYLNQRYAFTSITVDYVVVWFNKESREHIKHPLCKIVLKKSNGMQ